MESSEREVRIIRRRGGERRRREEREPCVFEKHR
jgi:hypothetical protein